MIETGETWLIYALGGGWGHLTRALSLGRIAARRYQVKILSNSPYAAFIQHKLPELGCQLQIIAPDAGLNRTCEQVREVLLNSECDRLIVDTFPRGLGGELADILPQLKHIPRILIHRDLKPEYVQKFGLRSFVAQNYDAVIVPGEGEDLPLADLPIVQHTRPWLIRNADELPDRTQARKLLHLNAKVSSQQPEHQIIDPSQKTILVCATGKLSELPHFGILTSQLAASFSDVTVRCLSPIYPTGCPPALWVSHWPAIECFPAADVVVGGGGYNTVYECAVLGVPLVALVWKRLYDRQLRRVDKVTSWVQNMQVTMRTSPIEAVQSFLNQQQQNIDQHLVSYTNGAVEAVRLIEQANSFSIRCISKHANS
ncbi:MAG: hypothetical protein KME08_00955 [Aphanothece sp. CMT-3BRIN-NPC111]|nr:hypothetical protein [Aphanothece sp. CMT-3BRIN-NPC111]